MKKLFMRREKIPEMYLNGMSTVAIGKAVGLKCGAVASILEARGIKRRTGKEAHKLMWPNRRFGELSSHWKGGRVKRGKGYIGIYSPDHPGVDDRGYVMEHRLVMEQQLGRYLEKGEIVHHINGDKRDNRPENLKLYKRGEHTKRHFRAIKEVAIYENGIKRMRAIIDEPIGRREIEFL